MRTIRHKGFSIIDIPIYDAQLLVSVNQSDSELKKSFIKNKINHKNPEALKALVDSTSQKRPTNLAKTTIYENGSLFIRVYNQNILEPNGICTMTHEMLHVVAMLFESRGLELTQESEEAYAYLLGYLMREVYTQLPLYYSDGDI